MSKLTFFQDFVWWVKTVSIWFDGCVDLSVFLTWKMRAYPKNEHQSLPESELLAAMAYEKYFPQSIPLRYPTFLLEIGDKKKKPENFQRASTVWITRSSWFKHVPGIRDEPRRCEDHVYCVTLELGQSSLREEVPCSFIGWEGGAACWKFLNAIVIQIFFISFLILCLDVLCFLLRRNNALESVQYFELPFFNRRLSGGAPADESHV